MSRFSRRTLLRGLGAGAGAALLAPLMTRLTSADGSVPCRFVFVVEGNCFEPITMLSDPARAAIDATTASPLDGSRWWYRRYAHESTLEVAGAALETAPALGPLAAEPLVLAQSATVFGLSSRIIGGGHSSLHGALSSARTIGGVPGGQTLDAFLASRANVRGATPYDALRLGVSPRANEPLDFGTCAFARGQAAPLILNNRTAYNAMFGSVGSSEGRAAFQGRRSLLDFARRDVDASLATFPGHGAERQKLETYLAAVAALRDRHDRIDALEPELSASRPEAPDTNPLYASEAPLERYRAHLQLATAALMGELTNVVVIGSGTGGDFGLTYSEVNSMVGRHDLHHGSGGSPALLADIHEVTRRQVEAIVTHMAGPLANTPEGSADGSMLDHTVIVFIGDNGEQHHSTASEFPVLLMGGSALGLRTGGRSLVYPGMSSDGHRQVSNLWNTVCHVAGIDRNDFGAEGPTRRAEGPLSELMA